VKKVLFIDNKIKVCKLIENIVDWKTLVAEAIDFVCDGITALEIIEKEKQIR
jgi:hypothetical protein